jgi:transmembrane sensor
MTNYAGFLLEDFLVDEFFLEWVLTESEESKDFWQKWLMSNPEKTELIQKARLIVTSIQVDPVRDVKQAEIDKILKVVFNAEDTKPATERRLFSINWIKIAAVFLIVASAGLIFHLNNTPQKESLQVVTHPYKNFNHELINKGTKTKFLQLSDGSSVILKPGSVIKLPRFFEAGKREVFLSGEAFFEISKNPNRPFIVYTDNITTKVLGTSFYVKANSKQAESSVIVSTGKVAVSANLKSRKENSKKDITLLPNQAGVFDNSKSELVKKDLDEPQALSHQVSKGLFSFKETSLNKVIQVLKDAYGVEIIYDQKTLARYPLTASLSTLSLTEKLDVICKALGADYLVKDGQIIIRKR